MTLTLSTFTVVAMHVAPIGVVGPIWSVHDELLNCVSVVEHVMSVAGPQEHPLHVCPPVGGPPWASTRVSAMLAGHAGTSASAPS